MARCVRSRSAARRRAMTSARRGSCGQIVENRDVAARRDAGVAGRPRGASSPGPRSNGGLNRNAPRARDGARAATCVRSFASFTFGSSNGLIAERRADHRRRELPPEELRAQLVGCHLDLEHRVAGSCASAPPTSCRSVVHGRRITTNARSSPYSAGLPMRLADDRQDAAAVLARALGDQLLDPRAEALQGRLERAA